MTYNTKSFPVNGSSALKPQPIDRAYAQPRIIAFPKDAYESASRRHAAKHKATFAERIIACSPMIRRLAYGSAKGAYFNEYNLQEKALIALAIIGTTITFSAIIIL